MGRGPAAMSAVPCTPAGTDASRQAGRAARRRKTTTMASAPAPRMARLTSMPSCSSARRAAPIGNSGDSATATATAIAAAAPATIAVRPSASPTSCARVSPRARRTGTSVASSLSWRESACPSTRRPGQSREGGEHQEGDGLGRIARWTRRSRSRLSAKRMSPPTSSARSLARRSTAVRNAAMSAPSRNRTAVPSKFNG